MRKNLLAIPLAAIIFMVSCQKEQVESPKQVDNQVVSTDLPYSSSATARDGGGSARGVVIGGINIGNLNSNLFVFTNASEDANWQGATKGFIGDVAVNGDIAMLRTSGNVPYSGIVSTSSPSLRSWQNIINSNPTQAVGLLNQSAAINDLTNDLEAAFVQINGLAVTPGYAGISPQSLNGLNTLNGMAETFVFNISSGFQVKTKIGIIGDADDVYIFRWDSDQDFSNGYNGQVKFQSGGAIVPLGELTATNFLHVAGDINASGGGSNPGAPYPQGPRTYGGTGTLIQGGSDFNGGGFFTGYWLTTGKPEIFTPGVQAYGKTSSLSNAIFVGGWYSTTSKFSMTSGTSGVYVSVRNRFPFEPS